MNYTIRKAVLEDSADINNLLTLLIRDEKKYDFNINENCVVKGHMRILFQIIQILF